MYSEMARVDEQLEMVSRYLKRNEKDNSWEIQNFLRIKTDGGSLSKK